jgi:hypothetical protein
LFLKVVVVSMGGKDGLVGGATVSIGSRLWSGGGGIISTCPT